MFVRVVEDSGTLQGLAYPELGRSFQTNVETGAWNWIEEVKPADGSVGRVEQRLVLLPKDDATIRAMALGFHRKNTNARQYAEEAVKDRDLRFNYESEIDALNAILSSSQSTDEVARLQAEVERLGKDCEHYKERLRKSQAHVDSLEVERKKNTETIDALRTQLAARTSGDGPSLGNVKIGTTHNADGKLTRVVVAKGDQVAFVYVDNPARMTFRSGGQTFFATGMVREDGVQWLDTPAPPAAEAKGIDLESYAKRFFEADRKYWDKTGTHSLLQYYRECVKIEIDIARAVAREETKGGQA